MNPKTTTDNLFAMPDLAVLEQVPDGLFRPAGRLPQWFAAPEGPIDLAERYPILEIFLPDCQSLWESRADEWIQSDVWTEPDGSGGEIYLQAAATSFEGRNFIVVKSLPQALFTYQQLAHDFELEKDKVARLNVELEAKRREADRATQAKSDFLATMSHEIRTPLNAIIGMADVLSLTSLTADQKKYVEIFQRNGVALLNLINDILDLSKVESRHVELEAADLDLEEVLKRAMEVVEVRVAAKGLSLRYTIAPGVPRYLIGDPNRLRQIVINLLGNSIKFTEHGGLTVKVELDPENPAPGHLRFAISDTGIGIPENKLGAIFESFTQVDASTTRKYGGTGLGLTISKQLVELMDGRIWVESTLGVGSTFFFTGVFKLQEDQSVHAGHREAVQALSPPSIGELEADASGLRILLVDDSEDNRVLILSYLKRTQSKIDSAENGRIAVDLFGSNRYDVVLMDVEMPVMDGYEAVREIRRIEKENGAAPTPVLALTAHAFAEMSVKGYDAGFTELLTKPIRHVTLLAALAKYRGAKVKGIPEDAAQLSIGHSAGATIADQAERKLGGGAEAPPHKVLVEEGMEDVVPGYLDKRRAEVAIYRKALEAADFETIKQLAHKMKGTGGGYGFPLLTEFGTAMENAARQCDGPAVRVSLEEFAHYVEIVELEYVK
jgi:signal transduction histidine kinase/CheY-like chemotaxis protein/HPt (histidine-containing phosphotransfer) domain-containing protein